MINKSIALPVIIFSIVSLSLGIILGISYYKIRSAQFIKSDKFFDYQSAMVKAKIIGVNGKTITIENSKGVLKADAADNIYIIVPKPDEPAPIPSKNLKDIQLNKEANIGLESSNNNFKIIAISYPVPKILSPSVKPAGFLPPIPATQGSILTP